MTTTSPPRPLGFGEKLAYGCGNLFPTLVTATGGMAMFFYTDVVGLSAALIGTDLSTAMVESATRALYPLERARNVSKEYLQRYCRKGQGDYDGMLLIARELRDRVSFGQANLMQPLPELGQFDLIFLRNVLIYFDLPAKEAIVRRVLGCLKPDGVLFTGHAESINGAGLGLRTLQPAVYGRA